MVSVREQRILFYLLDFLFCFLFWSLHCHCAPRLIIVMVNDRTSVVCTSCRRVPVPVPDVVLYYFFFQFFLSLNLDVHQCGSSSDMCSACASQCGMVSVWMWWLLSFRIQLFFFVLLTFLSIGFSALSQPVCISMFARSAHTVAAHSQACTNTWWCRYTYLLAEVDLVHPTCN